MTDWSGRHWTTAKSRQQSNQQVSRLITISHHRSAEKGRPSGESFDEVQAKINEWKATAPLIPCKLPGVVTISADGCEAYRRGKREGVSDDEFVILLDICNACRGERRAKGLAPKKKHRGASEAQIKRRVSDSLGPCEVAKLLHVSAWRVMEWCKSGKLKANNLALSTAVPIYAIPMEEFDRFRKNVWPRIKGPASRKPKEVK